jgi:hypothetical protein
VEHVCLWSPPVHERGDQRGVEVESRQPLRPGTMLPYTLHGTRSVTLRLVNSQTIRLSKRRKNGLHRIKRIKRPTRPTQLTTE